MYGEETHRPLTRIMQVRFSLGRGYMPKFVVNAGTNPPKSGRAGGKFISNPRPFEA